MRGTEEEGDFETVADKKVKLVKIQILLRLHEKQN